MLQYHKVPCGADWCWAGAEWPGACAAWPAACPVHAAGRRATFAHVPAGVAVCLLFSICVIYMAADFRYPLPKPFVDDCAPAFTSEGACMGAGCNVLHGACLHAELARSPRRAAAPRPPARPPTRPLTRPLPGALFPVQPTPRASASAARTRPATPPSSSCPPPSSPPQFSPRPCGSAPGRRRTSGACTGSLPALPAGVSAREAQRLQRAQRACAPVGRRCATQGMYDAAHVASGFGL